MRLRDIHFAKTLREMPRRHRRAAIGVDGKTIGVNIVGENCFPDKHSGKRACFAAGEPPSNNTSAVQVKDDVEVVIATECGRKFGDVPSPNLVWSCRTKSWDLGLRFGDVHESPFFDPVFDTFFAPSTGKFLGIKARRARRAESCQEIVRRKEFQKYVCDQRKKFAADEMNARHS